VEKLKEEAKERLTFQPYIFACSRTLPEKKFKLTVSFHFDRNMAFRFPQL